MDKPRCRGGLCVTDLGLYACYQEVAGLNPVTYKVISLLGKALKYQLLQGLAGPAFSVMQCFG